MNKPVAYIDPYDLERLPHYDCHIGSQQLKNGIPLYTHPHPDNLGLALSIIDQQKLEIENLRKADLTQKSLCKAELTKKDVEAARKEGYEFGYAQGCMHEKYGINGTNPIKELTDAEIEERIEFLKEHGASERFLQVYEEAVRWTLFAILRKAGA